jgi:N4-(beta-N-acetylglucosaminyl)-L-asparaginase
MSDSISRRRFVNRSIGVGAGAALLGKLPVAGASLETLSPGSDGMGRGGPSTATTPLIITSHSNETGQAAMRDAWEILSAGGSALDAVEKGANVIEVDPEDTSVGYGGLPNERGVVQLDSSIMDGRTYSAGSVASLEGIKTPASIARLVMERTDHVMLVGPGALEFAKSWGFEETDLLTEKARQRWLRWREERSDRDDWGPPDHIPPETTEQGGGGGDESEEELAFQRAEAALHRYGTTNVLAVDANGDIAGITTTSGLAFKIPGRIGDSPIIGAGLYVDNDVGAAGATGRGEDVIKSCASYYIVMRMRDGMSPQEACEDAMGMILHKYRNVNPEFIPSEKFVAIDKAGEYGCAWMPFRDAKPRMSVRNEAGLEIYEGTVIGTD